MGCLTEVAQALLLLWEVGRYSLSTGLFFLFDLNLLAHTLIRY